VAGVVTQAACFAIFHLLPERMPQTFALGLAAGAMTVATRSLLPAIACHAAHNSMPLVMLWLAGGLSGAVESAPVAAATAMNLPSWTVAAALASVVAGTVMLGLAARGPGVAGRSGWKSSLLRALCLAGVVGVGCTSAAAGSEAAIEPTPKTQTANETVTAPASPQPLRVAVLPIAAAVEWNGDQPTGVMIDIWRELARRLGVETEFVRAATFKQLLEMLPAGEIDVALGPIAITQEREKIFDLTHPIFHSGFRIAVRRRDESGFLPAFRSLLSWQLVELLALLLLLVLASGHLLWWFERGDNPQSFPPQYPRGVWEAIWWIASTVVAGGCDNKHVATALGRAIAFTWMVGGIVLLAAFTSMLTATLTAEQVTGTIHGPRDLAGRTVGCQEMAVSVKIVRQRGGFPQEFSSLNDAFEALTLGMVEAVLGENQQLMFLANQPSFKSMKLVGPMFESFDYGLGLPSGSPSRERFSMAILQMREDGSLDRIREQWLGSHD
jgi:polar amino acid transport system substrate-binding protein